MVNVSRFESAGNAMWLYGRCLGAVLVIAFVSLGAQIHALVGSTGIAPASLSDTSLTLYALFGTASAALLTLGVIPGPALCLAIACYLQLFDAGSPFTSFQWDTLLLETSFLSLPATPWRTRHRLDEGEPPAIARWLLYVLLFKLMFASGWVKLASNDPLWADMTALTIHYWTQPLPNAVAYWVHQLPEWAHYISCAIMFAIEIAVPFAMLVPVMFVRRFVAAAFASLMLLIMLTGNYGFFNLLGLSLCVPLIGRPDKSPPRRIAEGARRSETVGRLVAFTVVASLLMVWTFLASSAGHTLRYLVLSAAATVSFIVARVTFLADRKLDRRHARAAFRRGTAEAVAAAMIVGSGLAMLGGLDRDSRSFAREALEDVGDLRMFNSYGLFAVMTTRRLEISIEGSHDGQTWQRYELPYKPGDPARRPPFLFGHMPRLDWQLWFAALGSHRHNPWLIQLMQRLTEGDARVLRLFAHNPFEGKPPRYVRAMIQSYELTTPGEKEMTGNYWRTGPAQAYAPLVRAK